MLTIMGKAIDVEQSEILMEENFEGSLEERWDAVSGNWFIEDGWLTGKHRENSGGMIYSKRSFTEDVMLDFYGKTISPCDNDLNFTWCVQGWDEQRNNVGVSYIGGLAGWWEGKAGIERYPDCKVAAATPMLKLEPGRVYHIQCGSIKGHCFIFVDDQLIIELFDPDPIDPKEFGKVGFGTYASQIQVRDVKVRRICWQPHKLHYTPAFD